MDSSLVQIIIAALGALGAGEIVRGIVAWVGGRQQRERRRVQELINDRLEALTLVDRARSERDELSDKFRVEIDKETSKRRRIAEHASELRRMLADAGITDIPDWPIDPTHI